VTEENAQPRGHAAADALALAAPLDPRAAAYLEEQTRLARLQAEDLVREDKLRHRSLRVHHIGELLKLAFELALALIFIALFTAIASAVWSAAHDDSLIIDAFKVPPDMAARGLTGDVVAGQLLDRLTQMQAETDSSRAPNTYASNASGDIKVEIPNTGVSIGEAYRYLAGWLGHQTHITGEIYRTDKGLVLTVRASGGIAQRFEGLDTALDKLVAQAAESVYRQTQPFRYAIYAGNQSSTEVGLQTQDPILRDLALNGPQSERPWAYTIWAYVSLWRGDVAETLRRARKAVELSPDHPLALTNLAAFEITAGHDQQAFEAAYDAQRALHGRGAAMVIPRAVAAWIPQTEAQIDEQLGDYDGAIAEYRKMLDADDFEGLHWNASYQIASDLARLHDVPGSRHVPDVVSDADLLRRSGQDYGWELANMLFPEFEQHAALGDWENARRDMRAMTQSKRTIYQTQVVTQVDPWIALADAKLGDFAQAWADIAQTPLDCYLCLRVRGRIDTAERNWSGAEYWFARAAAEAPSLPAAGTEWGAMLLAKGDLDGAIAKFESAHAKGPRFADALELWGEALIAKNRSDLALAKFEEAARYAPNWDRLHLKWGEALMWSGNKAEAKKQFGIAAGLGLSDAEHAELNHLQ
jgi:tetratricopeptide (TPR) repeat protein